MSPPSTANYSLLLRKICLERSEKDKKKHDDSIRVNYLISEAFGLEHISFAPFAFHRPTMKPSLTQIGTNKSKFNAKLYSDKGRDVKKVNE